MENGFIFCHDVKELLNMLDCKYVKNERWLGIDSSKAILKCALPSNENY